jgi:hypothetical protein
VSGVDDDTDDNGSNDNASNDNGEKTEEDMFFWAAREVMNWSTKKLGAAAMEDCQSRSFFGAWNKIILKVWGMLGEGDLLPKIASPSICFWLSIP